MKPCIKCGVVKPLSEFHKHKDMRDGRINKCKVCVVEYVRVRQKVRKICTVCELEFTAPNKRTQTCSPKCHSSNLSSKASARNEGMKMTYGSVHVWIKAKLGRPMKCSGCGDCRAKTLYDWSNISGEYKRDLSDWQRLCRKCHVAYDNTHNGRLDKRKGISDNRDRDALGRYI